MLFRNRKPVREQSERFHRRWRDTFFQVHDLVQDGGEAGVPVKSAVLSDPATGRTENLGFSQPVSVDDLKVVQILPTSRPTEEGHTRIKVGDRNGKITGQVMDGRVYIQFDGDEQEELVDLARTDYQWLVG